MPRDRVNLLVLLCFLLSGFAALIYQTTWAREFALLFGASELAVATVLAAYMGGLAGGAALGGRLALRIRRPVLAYALLEAGIAASALAVPFAVQGATRLYVTLFGGTAELASAGGTRTTLFFLVASLAILLIPTGLMGATLPLLARHAVRAGSHLGQRVGLLYATNTVGAVAGAVIGAFVLMPRLGLRGTMYTGVATSLAVFVLAALVAWAVRREATQEDVADAPGLPARFGWILPVILVSGVVSFTYEILWTRLLAHVLAGGVYAFATMLASFLSGIAIGSALAARRATDAASATRGFVVAQLATAALSLAAYLAIDWLPALSLWLQVAGGRELADPLVSVVALLPSTLCIGATFPFAVRILARDHRDASSATARVYAWNTVGAIVGSIAAGFWVIPALGFGSSIRLAAGANVALALAAAVLGRPRSVRLAQVSAVALVALLFLRPDEPWTLLRSGALSFVPETGEVTFHRVGRTATVLVMEQGAEWRLRTNGLPESSIQRRTGRAARRSADRWLALLPVLARPATASLLLVGLGGGVVVEQVPPSVRSVDVIELEPAVVEANQRMGPARLFDPLSDPRLQLRVNDARTALLLTNRRFDAIASQPSHPWTAGSSHLYTREFFRLVRDHLSPGGTFALWMGSSFVDEPILRGLVATLLDTFPYVRVYAPFEPGNLLFLASSEPLPLERTSTAAIAAAPDLFRTARITSVEDVEASLLLDESGARRFAEGAPVNTDDRNFLQMRSPRVVARGGGLNAPALDALMAPYEPFQPLPEHLSTLPLLRAMPTHGTAARAIRLAGQLPAKDRHAALGVLALLLSQPDRAGRELDAALALDPTSREVRALLLQLRRPAIEKQGASAVTSLLPLGPAEQVVVDGWRRASVSPGELADLEPALAAIPNDEPLWPEAQRLRASIRLARGGPEAAIEGIDLLDEASAHDPRPTDFVLRSQLLVAADDPRQALDTLLEVVPWFALPGQWRPVAQDALAQLDRVPDDGKSEQMRAALRTMLEAAVSGRLVPRPGAGR